MAVVINMQSSEFSEKKIFTWNSATLWAGKTSM